MTLRVVRCTLVVTGLLAVLEPAMTFGFYQVPPQTDSMGHCEFVALRARAKQKMGPRFDVRAFHAAVMGGGDGRWRVTHARAGAGSG